MSDLDSTRHSTPDTRHLHVFGASGSGTTTLGRALAERLGGVHLDVDDYHWLPTDPPFQTARERSERIALLRSDLDRHPIWVLSGSLCGWGDPLIPLFDVAVFLWIPTELRMERLRRREEARFGDALLPGGSMHDTTVAFMEWAARYDSADESMRSRRLHERWIAELPCPVVRIEKVMPVEEEVQLVLKMKAWRRGSGNAGEV